MTKIVVKSENALFGRYYTTKRTRRIAESSESFLSKIQIHQQIKVILSNFFMRMYVH